MGDILTKIIVIWFFKPAPFSQEPLSVIFENRLTVVNFLISSYFAQINSIVHLISKIKLQLVTAFYFFSNQAKFEKLKIGALSSMNLSKIMQKRDNILNEIKSQNRHTLLLYNSTINFK